MNFFARISRKSRISKIGFLLLGVIDVAFFGFFSVMCLIEKWYLDAPFVALVLFVMTILMLYSLGDTIYRMITQPDFKSFIKEVEGLGIGSLDDFANRVTAMEKHPAPKFGNLYLDKDFIFYEHYAFFGSYLKAVAPKNITAISIYTVPSQNKNSNYICIFCGEEKSGMSKKKMLRTVAKIPMSDQNAVELCNELRALYAEHLEDPEHSPIKALL